MQRTNLAPVILQLKALGIDNVLRFSFLSVSGSLCIHRVFVVFSPTEIETALLYIFITKNGLWGETDRNHKINALTLSQGF